MAWTYGYSPSTTTATGRRDAVRLLVGDNDPNDRQEVQDAEIYFALAQTNDNVYNAAALVARTLAGKYSRLVDTDVDGVSMKNSDLSKAYHEMSRRLEKMAIEYNSSSVGAPIAGGIRVNEMEAAEDDTDRVPTAFRTGQFRNPQVIDDAPWRRY